jgi:uncharacterized delta-60 repeat protein
MRSLAIALTGLALLQGCDDDSNNSVKVDAAVDAAAASTGDGAVVADSASSADAGPATGDAGAAPGDAAAGETGAPAVADTDLVLVRFNADGTVDNTFGTMGVSRIDLGPGSGTTRDTLAALGRDDQNRFILFATKKGDGSRIDQDRVVVRVTSAGALDETFATKGVHTLNIANLNDNLRGGLVQADGKILAAGYTSQPTGVGTQSANKIVLLRLEANGMPDNAFGVMGVVNSAPLQSSDPATIPWGFAEAYGAARQADGSYVTTGYGRSFDSPGTTVNMLSFRYSAAGKLDPTWNTTGVQQLDIAGDNDRGRAITALPGDKILIVGSATPMPMTVKPLAVTLQANGALDPSFDSDGHKVYDFGKPDEAFWATATAGGWAAAVGYSAGGGMDDDATLLLLPVGGAGAEVAKAVPLSQTENDRFWAVTFDAAGKVLAAGFVTEGGDSRLAVARFNADGTPDTTFGGGTGVAKINVKAAGTDEVARGVVVQTDGKIVIAGAAER